MSEQKYQSRIGSIPNTAANVYAVLSNLQNLERVRDLIPKDKVQELYIEPDAIRLKVDGLGQMLTFRIVDKIENDTIKFGVDDLPLEANFWIQLKQVTTSDTRVRLTLKADIPMMFRLMLEKKIQKGLDDGVQMLTQFPYDQWLS